jgi:cell division initiation protein
VISQAEVQAEKIIQNAHTRLVRILDDINELKRQKAQFEGNLRSLIDTHGKLLDAMSDRIEHDSIELTGMSRRVEASSADVKLASLSDDKSAAR